MSDSSRRTPIRPSGAPADDSPSTPAAGQPPRAAPGEPGADPAAIFFHDAVGEPFTTVGEELRRERELREVTLKEIAEETKISLKNLVALEHNEFHKLPGGVYTKNFIRAYCRYLGISEEKVINNYLYQINPRKETLLSETLETQKGNSVLLLTLAAIASGALFIAIAVVLYSHLTGATRTKGVADLLESGAAQARPASSAVSPAPDAGSAPTALRVVLRTTDQTFLSIKRDGEKMVNAIVPKGNSYEISAQERVDFEIGDSLAVALTINGIEALPLGKKYDPRTFTLTPANLSEFLPAPVEPSGPASESGADREETREEEADSAGAKPAEGEKDRKRLSTARPARETGPARPTGGTRATGPARPTGASRTTGPSRASGPARTTGPARPTGQTRTTGTAARPGASGPRGETGPGGTRRTP